MQSARKLFLFIILLSGMATLQACNDGPAEEAGEALDEAADDVGDAFN